MTEPLNTHANKTGEHISRSAAPAFSKRQENHQWADNRPEAAVQRKLQALADNSSQVKQLKAISEIMNSPRQQHDLGSPGGSAPIQLYTSAAGKKISANTNYYVKDTNDKEVFVRAGATIGDRGGQIVATGATEAYSGATYTAYHYYADDTGGFVNDCLGLAELLADSTKVASGRAEFRAPGSGGGGGKLFGHTYSQNTEIAKDNNWYTDEATDPAIGEAYAIAPTVVPGETGKSEAPYHVAAVVAKDGADNITLEADAGSPRTRPLFDMYDTQPSGTRLDTHSKTFHEVYASGFTYKREKTYGPIMKNGKRRMESHAPSTGVLRSRTD